MALRGIGGLLMAQGGPARAAAARRTSGLLRAPVGLGGGRGHSAEQAQNLPPQLAQLAAPK